MYTGIVELDKKFLMSQIQFPIKKMKNRNLWEAKDWKKRSIQCEEQIEYGMCQTWEGIALSINF